MRMLLVQDLGILLGLLKKVTKRIWLFLLSSDYFVPPIIYRTYTMMKLISIPNT